MKTMSSLKILVQIKWGDVVVILDHIIVIKRSSLDQCLAVLTIRTAYPPVINLGIRTCFTISPQNIQKISFGIYVYML
ncbi:unnamed protein product, partial [Sphagnum jensenii]